MHHSASSGALGLFILQYIDDVTLRQKIEKQLNKGELANRFSSAITFMNTQEIQQSLQEDQEVAAMCRLILQNIIVLWNYIELTKLIMRSDHKRQMALLQYDLALFNQTVLANF